MIVVYVLYATRYITMHYLNMPLSRYRDLSVIATFCGVIRDEFGD